MSITENMLADLLLVYRSLWTSCH